MIDKLIKYSPYIYLFLATMILPLANIDIRYVHYVFLILITILLLPYFKNSSTKKKNLNVLIFIFFTLFISLITPLISSIKVTAIVEATLVYILPALFWVLFFTKYRTFDFRGFLIFSVYIALFISLLGFIQFFFSRTIFGFIPEISYFSIDFTEDFLVSSGSIFRVRSILPSPQIFGLYTSLSFCLSTFLFKEKKINYLIISTPILLASLLSGQRIVILVYLVYFTVKALSKNKNILLSLFQISFFVIIILFALNVVNDILIKSGMASTRLLDVFTDFSSVIDYEQNSRWTRWAELIKNTNPLLGNGIGYTFPSEDGSRIVTTESYLVQLYFEGGLLLLASFIGLFYNSFKSSRMYNQFSWPILASLFVSLIVVHSFTNPIFFIYWGVLIYPLLNNKILLVQNEKAIANK